MTYDYLPLDRNSPEPLYRQLYLCIRDAVENGHLKKGEKLPSVRKLSEDLSLSCTTVESAYQQLCVEGYVKAEPHRGYFALAAQRSSFGRRAPTPTAPRPEGTPVRYNFGSDCVDENSMDLTIWRRNVRNALNRRGALASYGEHQGESVLREALSAYSFGARGVIATPEQIVIGAGTQPLLSLLCGLAAPERRTVAMEEPGFPQAEQIFADCGFSVLRLPCDGDGIRMDALVQSGASLVYLSPSNRLETGAPIPMSRRLELLNWTAASGGTIIEDDYNGELRYRARPVPAMQGIAEGKSVVYLGSFSKLLLPGVRIGYMALPQELLTRYLPRAAHYNQTASKVEQLALAEYIGSGQMERHLRRLRKLYGEKSGELLRALHSEFGAQAGILLQETTLTVILTPAGGFRTEELLKVARAGGVRVQEAPGGKLRLGFAGIPLEEIAPAVHCLKTVWGDVFSPRGTSQRRKKSV